MAGQAERYSLACDEKSGAGDKRKAANQYCPCFDQEVGGKMREPQQTLLGLGEPLQLPFQSIFGLGEPLQLPFQSISERPKASRLFGALILQVTRKRLSTNRLVQGKLQSKVR